MYDGKVLVIGGGGGAAEPTVPPARSSELIDLTVATPPGSPLSTTCSSFVNTAGVASVASIVQIAAGMAPTVTIQPEWPHR